MKNRLLPVTIILSIALVLSIACSGFLVYSTFFKKDSTQQDSPIEYSAENVSFGIRNITTLMQEFDDNIVTTYEKYVGNIAEFTGTVKDVCHAENGFYIILADNIQTDTTANNINSLEDFKSALENISNSVTPAVVHCYFDDSNTDEIKEIKTGDSIIITGKITDYKNGVLIVEQCRKQQQSVFPQEDSSAE